MLTSLSFALFPPSSPLLHKAVARMNYLHAPYIKSKRILNQDLLYVLYTAMVEPIRFMRLYEWRSLTEMEVAAQATLWKYVGDMMGIDYAEQLGKNKWNDGIEFMEDVTRWGCKYEDNYMLPLPEVQHLGTVLVDLLLSAYPKMMRPLGYQMLLVLMGERMRYAFGYVLNHHCTIASSKLTLYQLCGTWGGHIGAHLRPPSVATDIHSVPRLATILSNAIRRRSRSQDGSDAPHSLSEGAVVHSRDAVGSLGAGGVGHESDRRDDSWRRWCRNEARGLSI